jgi:SAM-dependent methyltransferase
VGFSVRQIEAADIIYDALMPDYRGRARAHQQTLFRMLGFHQVDSIDYFSGEGPTYQLDLNYLLPPVLHSRYDLVYDGGCMEHCFNVAQVMANAVMLLKPGGRVIHHVPMNREINHGFYQFSPTLFFDYYDANGFDEMEMKIHFQLPEQESYFIYDPRRDRPLPFSFGYEEMYIFFSARKRVACEQIVYPPQSRYASRSVASVPEDQSTAGQSGSEAMSQKWRRRFLEWLLGDRYIIYHRKSRYWIDKRRMRRRVERLRRESIRL